MNGLSLPSPGRCHAPVTMQAHSPVLHEEVTIILVTSFTAACPSTALIEATLSSFAFVPGLEQCRLVIVADGFVLSHRRRTKAGRLTEDDAVLYSAYVDALGALVAAADPALPSLDRASTRKLPAVLRRASLLRLEGHHGFGWAIKAALESGLVTTRHILVVQHDRCFMRTFELARAVGCMQADDRVRYLLVPTRSTRNHAETMTGRCNAKLPQIHVNGVRLQQLAFWWDSTHLATADHYLNFVFRERCVKRGTFPEDTLGKQLLAEVKMRGVGAANRYHAYVWDDLPRQSSFSANGSQGGGTSSIDEYGVVGHLNGAHWRAWTDDAQQTDEHGAPLHNSRALHWQRSLAALDQREMLTDGVSEEEARSRTRSPWHEAGSDAERPCRGTEAHADESDERVVCESIDGGNERLSASQDDARQVLGLVGAAAMITESEDASLEHTEASRINPLPHACELLTVHPLVTVILPVHNGEAWLDGCIGALLAQTWVRRHGLDTLRGDACIEDDGHCHAGLVELSAYDDGSSDATWERLSSYWAPHLRAMGWRVVLGRGDAPPGGCGHAKNRAVWQSSGEWLCFQDVDDISLPQRIDVQLEAARQQPDSLIGARVRREPEGSTARYANWANEMTEEQLVLHRFRECTLLMPTWFIGRAAFERTGAFREEKCEDLLFLQAHVARGGGLRRAGGHEPLIVYRYHTSMASHAIPRKTIQRHRVAAMEEAVISKWGSFTIWGAGRDGRDFFKALSPDAKNKVTAFCDVDPKKLGEYQYFEYHVPVVHFTEASPPFVICVALDRTNGAFEANLASLHLQEGLDFYHFC